MHLAANWDRPSALASAALADCNSPADPVVCMAATAHFGYIVPAAVKTGGFEADIDMAGAELDHLD